jgi:hypothetical protein
MGTSLINTTPQDTYPGLIKTTDNAAISGTLKTLSDGNGNDFPMQISTTGVNFTGTLTQNGSPVTTPPSGVSGAIQFSNGSAFASDATNLFWDDTNNRLGVGTNTPTATVQIKGSGSTFGTTAVLVQNSAGTQLLSITNDGGIITRSNVALGTGSSGNINVQDAQITSSVFDFFNINVYQSGAYTSLFRLIGNNGIGQISIGTTTPHSSAKLQINSTVAGFLTPRMTTTERNAISSPAAGLMIYNTTTAKLNVFTTAWEAITSL